VSRAGPGVSPARQQALGLGQPPTPRQPMEKKKEKKNIYIHKRNFLLEGKKEIIRGQKKKKKKKVINQYTQ
jgi:hypothetical protein